MTSNSVARRAKTRSVVHSFSLSAVLLLTATTAYAVPPELAAIGDQSVREGNNLNISLSSTDPDGNNMSFSESGLPGFCSLNDGNGTGSIDCNPGAGTDNTYVVTITVTDDSGDAGNDTDSETFNIVVNANTAPTVSSISNQSVAEGASLNIPFTSNDGDGDNMSFSTNNLPGFCSLNNGNGSGSIDCNPLAGDGGNYNNIEVIVTDDGPIPEQSSETFNLSVSANNPPVLSNISNQSVAEGDSLNIALSASDPDGDSMSFSTNNLPGFCTLNNGNGSGSIDCNPQAGDGGNYDNIEVIVTDDAAVPAQDSDTFNLSVSANNAPVLTNIDNQSVAEGGSISIPLSASDPDGDNLSFSTNNLPGFCTLNNGNGSGSIECNPQAGDGGNYNNIEVTVTDDGAVPAQDSDTFNLSVSSNTPPVLSDIDNQSVEEGGSINIPLSASDADGDNMSFSTQNLPSFCSLNNGNGSGSIDCNPGAGTANNYVITVTVTDDGPVPAEDSDSFTLSVGANAPPQLTNISDQNVIEGDTINIALSANDPDGDSISFSASGLPGFCSLTDNGNGSGAIDCSPQVGDGGSYGITVTATDDGAIPAESSDSFTLSVGANQAPTASNVAISGDPSVGSQLTGSYDYDDAEDDPEGTSTFRWLRDGAAIGGATGINYTISVDDVETNLRFEVTPVASAGASTGTPQQSADLRVSNSAPSITGQAGTIEIAEDTSREIVVTDVVVSDADSTFPDDFTIAVADGANYSRSGNTITPDLDFNGDLSVSVTVNDGFNDSNTFGLTVTVTPVNDAPTFVGVLPPGLSTQEDTTLTILVDALVITDPDNVVPDEITLTLDPNVAPDANYTIVGPSAIQPAENFNGQLQVRAVVNDGELDSAPFDIPVDVIGENDLPTLVAPIGSQTFVEDAAVTLNISANFDDADGEALTFEAVFDPVPPPERNIGFNGNTGEFTGPVRFAPDDPADPLYEVTVTAMDPAGESVSDTFDLTLSQLGRANLGLAISVSPESALPNEELRWTFTTDNPVGPVAGENVELTGTFLGDGLSVGVVGGATCNVNTVGGGVDFSCTIGGLGVGQTAAVELSTTATQATEVVVFANTAGAQPVPIDPNPTNNSAVRGVGVAESFSIGAAQILGNRGVRSVDAGDVNGDGLIDVVVGTDSNQPVQIFLADVPRETCDCQRDFMDTPISIPDNGVNEGVALADFDGNGSLDLVVANGGGQTPTIWINDGAGNFAQSQDPALQLVNGRDVAVGDFDNDGNMDFAIAANSPNPVYFGNGNGTFSGPTLLGDEVSLGVAAANLDGNARMDLAFANVGSNSRVYTKGAGTAFTLRDQLNIGDATSVAAQDLNGDGIADLVFGRVSSGIGDVPANPVLINNGTGRFGAPSDLIGVSPTNDVMIGDVNEDGAPDIVVINESGVHQVWSNMGGNYVLQSQQIIDLGARRGALAALGDTDNGDPGGPDLAIGSSNPGGVGVYLNDSVGNLGRGDLVPPVIELIGNESVSVDAGTNYSDSGATATDNIDETVTPVATSTVNTAVVGTYTVTYNATDFAGNEAEPVVRQVTVTAATGRGGGGGGAFGYLTIALLTGAFLLIVMRVRLNTRRQRIRTRDK